MRCAAVSDGRPASAAAAAVVGVVEQRSLAVVRHGVRPVRAADDDAGSTRRGGYHDAAHIGRRRRGGVRRLGRVRRCYHGRARGPSTAIGRSGGGGGGGGGK